MLSFLLSPVYRFLATIGAVLAAVWTIYAKGRADASLKDKARSLEETQDAIERANKARNNSLSESDRGRLYDDDGFKRPN
ncbi:MAG: hypothetical protein ACO3S0_15355 [bacterium]